MPRLLRAGTIRSVEPDRAYVRRGHLDAGDPLGPSQWWLAAVGATAAEPPGPGRPVTILDSGIDVTHPEFAGRPGLTLLNGQDVTAADHGTAVGSIVGAPANGLGLVGVYPEANLNVWDDGVLTVGSIDSGIEQALARGPGVVNMSFGGTAPSPLLGDALLVAFGAGSLLVASAGNEFEQGNPIEFPASYNHVLTIAATDETDAPAYFSSASLAVDLAAPGANIPVAVPASVDPSGFSNVSGHELRGAADRVGRGGLGLDGAAEARQHPGLRSAPLVGSGRRRTRLRRRHGLRSPRHPGRPLGRGART